MLLCSLPVRPITAFFVLLFVASWQEGCSLGLALYFPFTGFLTFVEVAGIFNVDPGDSFLAFKVFLLSP